MQVEQVVIYFQVSIGTIFYRTTNIQDRLIKGYNCCRIRMNLEYFMEEAHIERRRAGDLDPDHLLRLPFLLNLLHDLTRDPGPADLGPGLDPDGGVPQPPELRSGERQLRHPRRRARGPRRCRISNWRRCEITDRRHCRISWLHASRATPLHLMAQACFCSRPGCSGMFSAILLFVSGVSF